jgi:hypothetical protein
MTSIYDLVRLEASNQCADLTGLQIVAGFVSWANILKVFALVLGAVCVAYLVYRLFGKMAVVFKAIPDLVYDILGYSLPAILIVGANFVPQPFVSWMVVPGCILFAGLVMILAKMRGVEPDHARFSLILTVVWGAVALFYQDGVVGFMTVMSFMSFVGFSVLVTPLQYCIGFKDEQTLDRATATALGLCLVLVAKQVWVPELGRLSVFVHGVEWLGPFVFGLGMLLKASRWIGSGKGTYLPRQLVAIIAYMAMIAAGSILGIDALRNVGVGFLILFMIEKPFEIPYRSAVAYAITGLLVSLALGYGAYYVQGHPEAVAGLFQPLVK